MPCDLPHSCFDCPELQEYRDKHGLIEIDMYFCPIAMQGRPADALKAVAQDA